MGCTQVCGDCRPTDPVISLSADDAEHAATARKARSRAAGKPGSPSLAQASGEVHLRPAHMQAKGRHRVCIDFGSMGCMGLLGLAHRLLDVLLSIVQQLDIQAVLLTGALPKDVPALSHSGSKLPCTTIQQLTSLLMSCWREHCGQCWQLCSACSAGQWTELTTACAERASGASSAIADTVWRDRVVALEGHGHHAAVLPSCAAAVHHAGAGTVAAVLRAGVPSVACPLHFDQFVWVRMPRTLFECGSSCCCAESTPPDWHSPE